MTRFLASALAALALCGARPTESEPVRILLIGKDRDHPFTTHEYMADSRLLAKCLEQTEGVKATVSNGWPADAAAFDGVKSIVLHNRMGGDFLFHPSRREQAERLLKKGVGLVAIHWATGVSGEREDLYRKALGGSFNVRAGSQYHVRKTMLKQAAADHPVCRGWKDFELREEYYIKLKFVEEAKPVFKAEVNGVEYPIGWVYERPDGGRSFGTVGGHFHDNFGVEAFRRGVVNGILWTAGVEVPADGAPCAITPEDMKLPPDIRQKRRK